MLRRASTFVYLLILPVTDRQTDSLKDKQADRQTDRQADRQTDLSQSLCTKSSDMKGQFLEVSLWILAQLQPHLVW